MAENSCPCLGHPFNCYGHPNNCGCQALTTCTECARLAARVAELEQENDRIREVCGEIYQVVGYFLGGNIPYPSDDDIGRALDNIAAAANGDPIPHDDLLPWPRQSALAGKASPAFDNADDLIASLKKETP